MNHAKLSGLAVALLAVPTSGQDFDLTTVSYSEAHLVVRTDSVDPELLASLTGTQLVLRNDQRGLYLFDVGSPQYRDHLAHTLGDDPAILYSTTSQNVEPPDIHGCGLVGSAVGAQQCTIAFIDENGAPSYASGQPLIDTIGAIPAQQLVSTTNETVIAVIDTGLDVTHSHFVGRIAPGGYDYLLGVAGGVDVADGLDNDGDGSTDEGHGHGSHVAGLALLVNPTAKILPLRVLDSDGNGPSILVATAIFDAVDLGADVINLSLSMLQFDPATAEAILYAQYNGVEVVSSAGNSGGNVLFPADFDDSDWTLGEPTWLPPGAPLSADVLGIGGVDNLDVLAVFSCWGPELDLCAPSVDLYSSMPVSSWAWWSGTSMGAGVASGAISFLQSIWDQGSYAGGGPKELLLENGVDIDALNPGFAGSLGAGRLDLYAAAAQLLGS